MPLGTRSTTGPDRRAILRAGLGGVTLLAGLMSGCGPRAALPTFDGRLDLLGDDGALGLATRKGDGFFRLGRGDGRMTALPDGGVRLTMPGPLIGAGRRIEAPLLALPFLEWRWSCVASGEAALPRLLIGFEGGDGPTADGFPGLPGYDRIAMVAVDPGAPVRVGQGDVSGGLGRMLVEGDMAGRAWTHTLDLPEMHRALWPTISPRVARTVFVAMMAGPATAHGHADLIRLRLSR